MKSAYKKNFLFCFFLLLCIKGKEENIMVRVEQSFDSRITKEINNNALKKLGWVYWVFSIILFVCGIANIYEYVIEQSSGAPLDTSTLIFGIIFTILGCLFFPPLAKIVIIRPLQKSINKKQPLMNGGAQMSFCFDDKEVIIDSNMGESFKDHIEADYSFIYRIEEEVASWSIFISVSQCFVVFKDKIIEGSVDELNEIFKTNMPVNKFKPLKKTRHLH
jgi:hypothetical protein